MVITIQLSPQGKEDKIMFFEEIIGAFTGQNKRTRRNQIAIGVALGAIGGAVMGILFAPQAGEDTRKQISDAAVKGANVVKDYSVETGQKIKEKVEETAEAVSKKARAIARDARQKAKEVAEDVAEVAEDAVEAIEEKEKEAKKK
jgi:gas vesicle protein